LDCILRKYANPRGMMPARMTSAMALAFVMAGSPVVKAATCSCAGAPLLSFIDTRAIEKGDLFVGYAAEYHDISDLVSGSSEIADETGRDRNSFSQVLTGSYAITDLWSVSALVSYVEHERIVSTSFLGKTSTSGLGDSVVMARYTPIFITPFSRHQLSLGLGARIPTGEDDFDSGFVASEDMQPGVGAWGALAWAGYNYAFDQAATKQLYASASFLSNGENDREYSFGDEYVVDAGFSHQFHASLSYAAALRYRNADADERFGFEIPNTGGAWLDFVGSVQVSPTERLSVALTGRVPISRNLNGTLQFTTSYAYSLILSYGF
ncbi:MAG: transporter, partial [Xanthomonadales bacterium]|nr:transporter [Xanthomonadales bacterium]